MVSRDPTSTLGREIIQIYISILPFSIDRINATNYCFYVVSFIQFCARKMLQSILVLKLIFDCKAFSTKLYAHEIFGSQEFKIIFLESRQKVLADPWNTCRTDNDCNNPLVKSFLAFQECRRSNQCHLQSSIESQSGSYLSWENAPEWCTSEIFRWEAKVFRRYRKPIKNKKIAQTLSNFGERPQLPWL